jgi:hypothetical protein
MKHIVDNWNGTDYAKFVSDYIKQRGSFVGKDGSDWLAAQGKLYDPDIPEWTLIQETVKFEFKHEDLVLNKGLEVSKWLDNVPNTVVHLSHIFNYDPVATFVPLQHRIYNEKLLLKKINNYCPTAVIITIDKAQDLYKDALPTWHTNGEWNVN